MSSIFEGAVKSFVARLIKEGFDRIFRGKSKDTSTQKTSPRATDSQNSDKNHPWRLCSVGEHWVRTHPLSVPASGKGPERETLRRGHCRTNSGKSEIYTADELREIAQLYFDQLHGLPDVMPIPDSLGFPNGNEYDSLIAGWTKFWNEIFKPQDPLTANFVKALIATESSFRLPKDQNSKDGSARGLIQVTENTRKILQDQKGELRDHHIELSVEESREPTTNIAAGIRWLHHKKKLAERRLKREITWEDAAAEYKGIYSQLGKNKKADEIMKDLRGFHKRLKDQRK